MAAVHDETWILASDAAPGATVELDSTESTHLVRVLRLRDGTACTATDGSGSVYGAVLDLSDSRRARLSCGDRLRFDPPPPRSLAQAILKNRGIEDVLDLCAQTPLREFQPLWTQRVQVPRVRDFEHQMERLKAKAVAALQQSKQTWLCRILPPLEFEAWLERADRPVLICDAEGATGPFPAEAWLAIGPEGGLSPSEIALAVSREATVVSLGPSRLRATAAGFWALAKT